MATDQYPARIYRLPDVERITGLKRDTIYRKARTGQFPKPIKLSQRASGWTSHSIESWLADRIAASRGAA